jgi:predicted metalloprotease
MRLDDQHASQNVEDRRGGGGGIGRGSVGIGTLVIALAAGYFFGIDPAVILGLASSGTPRASGATRAEAAGQRRDGDLRRQGARQHRDHLADGLQ